MTNDSEKQREKLTKDLISLAVKLAKNREPKKITKKTFYPRDLIGKTIEECVLVGNPKPVFTSHQSPNPAQFEVQLYTDGTFLLADSWGDEECSHLDFYYHNGEELYHSSDLFG